MPEFPEERPRQFLGQDEFTFGRDLTAAASCGSQLFASDFADSLAKAGYRSVLTTRTAVSEELMLDLRLFAKTAAAYTLNDESVVKCVANCLAVAVAHQQLADAECVKTEARVRAEQIDTRIRTATQSVGPNADTARPIGQSPEWRQVLRKAALVALSDTTVFVQGESGTGKEVVARFIHRASPRRTGPFVPINCAALPEQLLESELFGYERGAFTGAHQAKAGQIELASGGVLFLDEVSEMSPGAQAKLLRVLQEREFQRLGGTRPVKANVRVIAASNRDLHAAVADGSFREDLYYRLQVFDIQIPPLRERRSDIPLLSAAFLEEFTRPAGRPLADLTSDASDMLARYDWPGNIRQLRNALERAVILAEGGTIGREHFFLRSPTRTMPQTELPEVERRTIEQIMHETDGNKSKAARRLGVTRTQLYCRLRKYGLDAPGGRNRP